MNPLVVTALLAALSWPARVCASGLRRLDAALQADSTTASATAKCAQASCPTNVYKPICGSDGVTYANECLFSVAECESDGELHPVTEKECPTDRALCGNIYCNKSQSCLKNEDGVSQPYVYCADLCAASNCAADELCVKRQVACINAPCPEFKSCVPKNKARRIRFLLLRLRLSLSLSLAPTHSNYHFQQRFACDRRPARGRPPDSLLALAQLRSRFSQSRVAAPRAAERAHVGVDVAVFRTHGEVPHRTVVRARVDWRRDWRRGRGQCALTHVRWLHSRVLALRQREVAAIAERGVVRCAHWVVAIQAHNLAQMIPVAIAIAIAVTIATAIVTVAAAGVGTRVAPALPLGTLKEPVHDVRGAANGAFAVAVAVAVALVATLGLIAAVDYKGKVGRRRRVVVDHDVWRQHVLRFVVTVAVTVARRRRGGGARAFGGLVVDRPDPAADRIVKARRVPDWLFSEWRAGYCLAVEVTRRDGAHDAGPPACVVVEEALVRVQRAVVATDRQVLRRTRSGALGSHARRCEQKCERTGEECAEGVRGLHRWGSSWCVVTWGAVSLVVEGLKNCEWRSMSHGIEPPLNLPQMQHTVGWGGGQAVGSRRSVLQSLRLWMCSFV
ncbi:hypothetical protein PybrP1_000645 [[Pythium] brassicae (nom. inval.)]|nr:hypothetical protein PybrP1_000645 [[Pythium] brassicae (nom. inval.)]